MVTLVAWGKFHSTRGRQVLEARLPTMLPELPKLMLVPVRFTTMNPGERPLRLMSICCTLLLLSRLLPSTEKTATSPAATVEPTTREAAPAVPEGINTELL